MSRNLENNLNHEFIFDNFQILDRENNNPSRNLPRFFPVQTRYWADFDQIYWSR